MSGWLWLAAVVAVLLVVWLVLAQRKAARPRPRSRTLRRRDLVTDTEFSSETFVPPETRSRSGQREPAAREAARGAAPEVSTRVGEAAAPVAEPTGPWGRVAVPDWEHPLPWSYGQTRLVLLVRDPYWLFSYWEITGEAHALAEDLVGREAWRRARPVLRVYDVTGGSHYDVAVDEAARNWHLNVGQPDRTWYVELGRVTAAGRFIMLARSNTVHTPRDGPSGVIDRRWPPLGPWAAGARGAFRPEAMPTSPGPGAGPGPGAAPPSSPGVPGAAWGAGGFGGYAGGGCGSGGGRSCGGGRHDNRGEGRSGGGSRHGNRGGGRSGGGSYGEGGIRR